MVKLRESGEMYLETIKILSNKSDKVRSIDIAEYMEFSKPSVSRAVSILKDDGYIIVDNNGYITLTEKGEEIATDIYEKHVVLTKLLVKLGVDPEIADQDACKIEHDISDETFEVLKKLYKKLESE
ncbi:MAG: metal-dependent transcriptional regulator [Erysipelotrichaceae bacterium]|jgi:Mn-dependent DtxR family transcriptional regulator|nr:metal-dependent transcriptional regulator [Bacillota bacterium]NLP22518.1 metal-dependent transcriptional regulator [Erysipelotrichaceae bacterium]HCY05798.1 DtxR family transcriptional regulator [Erysipelotrichaceae bacterium]